ncbi:MAG TPA: tyrosine-type recombinase/integrase [Thermodesulfobacteriota bacterium]|nr:tyrosine-type recombinase/integrase [Thermodesulfobacteriota bacterium]
MGVFKRWIKNKDGSKTAYWYIRYSLGNGKEKWESVGKVGMITKAAAQVRLEEKKRQVRLGELDMITNRIPTLSEFTQEYIEHIRDVKQNRSFRRTRQALDHFNKLFNGRKLNEISSDDIDAYKKLRLNQDAKPATVNRELSVVKNLFNLAYRKGKFFGRNPVTLSGMLEVHNLVERILTPEEEERLLKTSPTYLHDVIRIALNTGMRQGEILGLKWEWIDFEHNIITLPQTNTKSKKTRKIPVNPVVRTILIERKLTSGGSEFVFPSPKGIDSHLNWLKHSFKTACKKASIENLRFHDLRHTAATRLVESRIPLHAITKLLGHSTVKVTERYSHPEESVKEAVEILANFNQIRSNFRSNENFGK